jgi:hypothetical protein
MLHAVMVCCGLLLANPADSPDPEDVRAYQAAAAKVGRDADAHVRLASWCEAHGLNVERHKHLGIALDIDPDNAAARGLLGQVADKGEWRMPGTVVGERQGDAEVSATLALYHARRDKIPDTAQAHRQMAEWCDQVGLKAEATAHWTSVVRLNPAQEEAWKKLGYRKQKGRWMAPERVAAERTEAEAAQRRADAKWRPLLQKWKGWLDRTARRTEAEAALAELRDPRAVPSIWKVFIAGGAADQERAVQLLGQIDAPSASRALASLALNGASDKVRHSAATSLLRRDPREFAVFLISLLRDPIKYEVRLVEGPGKPGELYIEGQRANSRFFYSAPPPLTTFRPTDVVGFDYDGLPFATRVVGYANQPIAAAIDPLLQGAPDLTGAPQALARAGLGQAGMQLGEQMIRNQQQASQVGANLAMGGIFGQHLGSAFPSSTQNKLSLSLMEQGAGPTALMPLMAQVPVGRLIMQAGQQAALSRAQLQEDVAALDRYNKDVDQANERAGAALQIALGKETAPDRKTWLKWWTELVETTTAAAPVPRDKGADGYQTALEQRAMLPAFGAGAETTLLTLAGPQPFEAIRAGDLVLTQDTSTGALAFTPVLMIHHAERQPAKTISIGGSPIVVTDLERFWVAGKGWVMVLNLKVGDVIRALGNVARVDTVEDAGARPVYHVQVAAGRGIVVGKSGILAHDERMAFPSAGVFDAASLDTKTPPGH